MHVGSGGSSPISAQAGRLLRLTAHLRRFPRLPPWRPEPKTGLPTISVVERRSSGVRQAELHTQIGSLVTRWPPRWAKLD